MNVFYKIAAYKSRIYILLFLWLCLNLNCTGAGEEQENILATVDSRTITVEEFRLFYEFDPNFGIDSGGLPALQDQLHKYIDGYLAAEKAHAQHVTDDPAFARAIRWEQKSAMLRQLYRENVTDSIQITDEEIAREFRNANASVHVRHLFSEDHNQADRWYNQLQKGDTFENLAMQAFDDTALARSGGDLGWIILRDLDDDFAAAIATLGLNEISLPVRTRWGYHIIQLLNRKDQLSINPAELHNQQEMLKKRLRRKKSRELSAKFISDYIGELNPQPDTQTFRILLKSIVPVSELEKAEYSRTIIFSNDIINRIQRLPREIIDRPLIIWRDGSITLEQYVTAQAEIPMGNRPYFKSHQQLADQMGVWIRDELLLQEARRLDLDTHSRVKREVRNFIEEQSYFYYLNHQVNNLQVPPHVQDYFASENRADHPWQARLSRFHTLEQWKYHQAGKQLHRELRVQKPEIYINMPLLITENSRIDWEHRIRMFMIRKPS
jgi:hypothetical protein